jgi:hypothetical protein
MINLTLYFREGCWLCDTAEEMLNGLALKYGLNIRRISIDSDPELFELYRYDIPVIEFSDGSALHGRIRKKDLVAKLDAVRSRR